MFTAQAAEQLRRRLLVAMSMEEAKEVLGFPPNASPSPQEVSKAYKARAVKHHPDKGGDPRKMVELNVAVEILQGKRHEDRTVIERDPEEVQRRLDLDALHLALRRATEGMQKAKDSLRHFRQNTGEPYYIDLRRYLSDTFADTLDTIQDAAEAALKEKLPTAKAQVWKKADKLTEALGAAALRMGSKLGGLQKALDQLEASEEISLDDVYALWSKVHAFKDAFHKLRETSGLLTTLLVTTEVIGDLGDPYIDVHQMLVTFDESFLKIDFDSQFAEKNIKGAVEIVVEVLTRRSLGPTTKGWQDWQVPKDFTQAIEKLERLRTASERIAARFRKSQG